MKKLTALFLSFLMVLTCIPADARMSAAGTRLTQQFGRFFSDSLTAQERALIWQERDAEDEDGVSANAKAKHFDGEDNPQKRPEPQEDLENYFLDNEILSSFGEMSSFDQRQEELAFYILNSDWITGKGLSQGDKAVITGLLKLAQAFLSWMNIGLLDSAEALMMDKSNPQEGSIAVISDALANAQDGPRDIDALYVKIQHNAFHVVLLNQVDFEKVIKKYPEVAFLFDDLYTFFRWRYELRSRNEKYRLNENNIYNVMNSSTRINSFLGWWELANVAKWFMANTVKEDESAKGLYPFTMKSFEEEKENLKVDYRPSARDAKYFGRVWNCMQRYAAKKRHMEKNLPGQEPEAGVVLSPVRGFKSSVKRSVYKALAGLSDQEVYNSLISVRKQYVTMRARSEKKWQEFMQTQITPRISEKSEPAWKEKLVDPTAMINEDIKAMQEALSSLGTETPESQAPEENFDESEQADDENEPDESEIESENGQELADQVTQELRGRFGN